MKALIYESLNDSFNEHINWGKFNILKGEKEVALNEYMTAYQFDNKNIDLIETTDVTDNYVTEILNLGKLNDKKPGDWNFRKGRVR